MVAGGEGRFPKHQALLKTNMCHAQGFCMGYWREQRCICALYSNANELQLTDQPKSATTVLIANRKREGKPCQPKPDVLLSVGRSEMNDENDDVQYSPCLFANPVMISFSQQGWRASGDCRQACRSGEDFRQCRDRDKRTPHILNRFHFCQAAKAECSCSVQSMQLHLVLSFYCISQAPDFCIGTESYVQNLVTVLQRN